MKIITFVKQVPSSAMTPRIAESGDRIIEDGLSHEANEADLYAVEEAIYQRSVHGGSVVAVTIGPGRAKDALHLAYAKGVDHAMHVVDEVHRGANADFNLELAKAIVEKQSVEMVLTGIQADDDLQGQFGIALAERLGVPVITAVTGITLDPGRRVVSVTRELGGGFKEEFEVDLPCVLTIQFGIRPLQYTPVLAIVKARSRKIETIAAEALAVPSPDPQQVKVVQLAYPKDSGSCEIIGGPPQEVARTLVRKFIEAGVV